MSLLLTWWFSDSVIYTFFKAFPLMYQSIYKSTFSLRDYSSEHCLRFILPGITWRVLKSVTHFYPQTTNKMIYQHFRNLLQPYFQFFYHFFISSWKAEKIRKQRNDSQFFHCFCLILFKTCLRFIFEFNAKYCLKDEFEKVHFSGWMWLFWQLANYNESKIVIKSQNNFLNYKPLSKS